MKQFRIAILMALSMVVGSMMAAENLGLIGWFTLPSSHDKDQFVIAWLQVQRIV